MEQMRTPDNNGHESNSEPFSVERTWTDMPLDPTFIENLQVAATVEQIQALLQGEQSIDVGTRNALLNAINQSIQKGTLDDLPPWLHKKFADDNTLERYYKDHPGQSQTLH